MSLLKTDFFGVAVTRFFAARFSFDKIIDIDHAQDILKAEEFIAER